MKDKNEDEVVRNMNKGIFKAYYKEEIDGLIDCDEYGVKSYYLI